MLTLGKRDVLNGVLMSSAGLRPVAIILGPAFSSLIDFPISIPLF